MDNHEKAEQERRVYRRMILFFAGILVLVLLVGYSCYAVINHVEIPEQVIVTEETLQNTATILPEKSGNVHQLTEEDTRWSGYEDYLKKQLSYIEEKERVTAGLGTGFDVAGPVTKDSLNCIVKKDGKWGMVSVTGEVLVPLNYDRYSYLDKSGWVEFEKKGTYYVHDANGTIQEVYSRKFQFRMENEEAYLYRTGLAFMGGIKIKTIVPEILSADYFGIEYYNRRSGELLYGAVGNSDEVGMFSFPDESGRAVAIRPSGATSTIYYITENSCESRELELPEGINGRWFDFPGNYEWADLVLSNGWLKVLVCDAVPDFLIDKYEYYLAFLNVDTLELVRFPEEYQGAFTIYDEGYGTAAALRISDEEEEYYRYAVCKGDKKLTEEIYYWVEFGEKYVTAGCDAGVHILDYEGNVLAEYKDVSGSFINGRMLVQDETGVYFIDENLKKCSEYIVRDIVDGCFSRGIIIDGSYYFLEEFAEEVQSGE